MAFAFSSVRLVGVQTKPAFIRAAVGADEAPTPLECVCPSPLAPPSLHTPAPAQSATRLPKLPPGAEPGDAVTPGPSRETGHRGQSLLALLLGLRVCVGHPPCSSVRALVFAPPGRTPCCPAVAA